jgi:hypothetical protein
MKSIKTSERLPNKNGEYWVIIKVNSSAITKDSYIFDINDNYIIQEWKDKVIEWLDEIEEEITDTQRFELYKKIFQNKSQKLANYEERYKKAELDTQRLDWLEENADWDIIAKYYNWNDTGWKTLREFIDKQINNE